VWRGRGGGMAHRNQPERTASSKMPMAVSLQSSMSCPQSILVMVGFVVMA
jgi:hypothetical protein